jgi:hypothetical protein
MKSEMGRGVWSEHRHTHTPQMATSRTFSLRQVNNLKRKVGKYYTKKITTS